MFAATVLLTVPFLLANARSADDKEAVRQAVLDYVEDVYNVDPSRIERARCIFTAEVALPLLFPKP